MCAVQVIVIRDPCPIIRPVVRPEQLRPYTYDDVVLEYSPPKIVTPKHSVPTIGDDGIIVPYRPSEGLILANSPIISCIMSYDNVVFKCRIGPTILYGWLVCCALKPATGDDTPNWIWIWRKGRVFMFDVYRFASTIARKIADISGYAMKVLAVHASDPDAEVD